MVVQTATRRDELGDDTWIVRHGQTSHRGWLITYACAPDAVLDRWEEDGNLRLVLTEYAAPGGAARQQRRVARTHLTLDDRGGCRATQVEAPSLLFVCQDGESARAVIGDGAEHEIRSQDGDLLCQMTAGLLGILPAKSLRSLPGRLARDASSGALARSLVQSVRTHPLHAGAGVVIIKRTGTADGRTTEPGLAASGRNSRS